MSHDDSPRVTPETEIEANVVMSLIVLYEACREETDPVAIKNRLLVAIGNTVTKMHDNDPVTSNSLMAWLVRSHPQIAEDLRSSAVEQLLQEMIRHGS